MKRYCLIVICCLCYLSACAGGTLSSKGSLEEYPLREANPEEHAALKHCLKSLHQEEMKHFEKHKKYLYQLSKLNVDSECQGIYITLVEQEGGFIAFAQINKNDTSVRWSIETNGKIFEYGDEELGLDF